VLGVSTVDGVLGVAAGVVCTDVLTGVDVVELGALEPARGDDVAGAGADVCAGLPVGVAVGVGVIVGVLTVWACTTRCSTTDAGTGRIRKYNVSRARNSTVSAKVERRIWANWLSRRLTGWPSVRQHRWPRPRAR
jgi:hypothetical protein